MSQIYKLQNYLMYQKLTHVDAYFEEQSFIIKPVILITWNSQERLFSCMSNYINRLYYNQSKIDLLL